MVCIYILLPQIINIELPQTSSVLKMNINKKVKNYYIIDKFICNGLVFSVTITTIEKTFLTIKIIKTIIINILNGL